MTDIVCSSPGKVILFGEHAVVYDKLGIAGAVDERVSVKVGQGADGVELLRPLEPKKTVFPKEKLFDKLELFRRLYEKKEFDSLKGMSFVDSLMIVAGETLDRFGYQDAKIEISFKNVLKNVGRSASKASAIAMGLSKFLGKDISRKEASEIAYLGDVVAHGGTPSGIDTSTVTFGGYVAYRKSQGLTPLEIDYRLPLLIVDSGEPSKTGVTVPAVRRLYQENSESVGKILDEIDSISQEGLNQLQKQELASLGELMNKNHKLLRQLGVSTKKLDTMCELALSNGALGAKLTGGGGGGSMIALAKDEEHALQLKSIFSGRGFTAFSTSLGVDGTRIEKG